jgi:hypothetical protein
MSELTLERQIAVRKLQEKKWFASTDEKIRQELLDLPPEFDGYLKDLGERPENIGLIEVRKLLKLLRGNYMVISIFEVMATNTKQVFTYEYVSWRHGKLGGYKGVILIEIDGIIKYFLVKRGEKFPTAGVAYDAIGTNQFNPQAQVQFSLQANIENQIKKILEVDELPRSRFVDLGLLTPDPSMTNNHVGLFSMVLTGKSKEVIEKNITNKEHSFLPVGYHIEIHPIEELAHFISKCDDAFFLACFSRMLALGLISI